MGGIVDLDVLICEEQFGGCSVCENGAGLASAARRNARTWGIGESVLCERCARCMGIPGDFPQADLGNGYIRVTPLEY